MSRGQRKRYENIEFRFHESMQEQAERKVDIADRLVYYSFPGLCKPLPASRRALAKDRDKVWSQSPEKTKYSETRKHLPRTQEQLHRPAREDKHRAIKRKRKRLAKYPQQLVGLVGRRARQTKLSWEEEVIAATRGREEHPHPSMATHAWLLSMYSNALRRCEAERGGLDPISVTTTGFCFLQRFSRRMPIQQLLLQHPLY
jgi:hypothetical protein